MEINCVYMLILSYFSCQSKTSDSDIYYYSTGSISKKTLQSIQNRIFHPHHFSQPFLPSFPWADPRHPPSVRRAATGAEKVWRSARWPWHERPRASRAKWSSRSWDKVTMGYSTYHLQFLFINFGQLCKIYMDLYVVSFENTHIGNELNEDSLENVCQCRRIHCWSKHT